MMERIVKTIIEEGGTSLLQYVSARYTYHSVELWEELIGEGRLLVNGDVAEAGRMLVAGEELEYRPRPLPEPAVDERVGLLLADENYVALDKPASLPCHPAGCYFNHTLWAMLKEGRVEGLAPMEEVRFVNRLDKDTSGIVLLATNRRSAAQAVKLLARRDSLRQYQAQVFGEFPEYVDAKGWLYHDEKARVSKRRSFSWERPDTVCEDCWTELRRLQYDGSRSLVEATLHTGRTHQIRATLQSLGYPMVGDKMYGPDETIFLRFINKQMTPADEAALGAPRLALHATKLYFGNYRIESKLTIDN